MLPIVKFRIDLAKDFEALRGFLCDARFDGGRNLEWAVYGKHPDLKNLLKDGLTQEAAESIKKYITDFFEKHSDQISHNMVDYKKAWEGKSESYSHLINDIFHDRPWPTGEYAAYATIWGMFPRSIEDKTFQVPAVYDNKLYVHVIIAHEMLHFMFYDFLFEKHPDLASKEDNFLTWNVSEIFNSVVQNSVAWLDVFQIRTMTYPEHETIESDLRKIYPKVTQQNLNRLTEDIIRISKALVTEYKSDHTRSE